MPKRRDKSEPPGSSTAGTVMLLIAAGCAAFPTLRSCGKAPGGSPGEH